MTESRWTAPVVDRPSGPNVAPERQAAEETLLDYHRATLLWKCAGLTAEQLATRRCRRRRCRCSAWSGTWPTSSGSGSAAGWPASRPHALYWSDDPRTATSTTWTPSRGRRRTSRPTPPRSRPARAVLAAHDSTTPSCPAQRRHRGAVDIRALVLHMIEEYARHNGHADLLREVIDGSTGD